MVLRPAQESDAGAKMTRPRAPTTGLGRVVLSDAVRLAPGFIAQLVSGFGLTLILGIYLSPQALAVYTLYWVGQSYLSTVSVGWLQSAVIRYLSGEPGLLAPYLRITGRTALLLIGVLVLAGLGLTLFGVPPLDGWSILWTAALVIGTAAFMTFQCMLRGLFQQQRFSGSAMALALSKLGLLMAMLHVFGPTARNALAALALSYPLVVLLQWERIRHFRGEPPGAAAVQPSADTELWSRSLSYGLPLTFSVLALSVLQTGDRYLLAGLRPLEVVGIYAFWMSIAFRTGTGVQQMLFLALNPRLFQLHEDDPARARRIVDRVTGSYSLLMAPAFVVAGCWLPPLLLWFGVKTQYASGGPLVFFGMAVVFLLGQAQIYAKPLEFRGKTLPFIAAALAGVAVMVVGVLLAAPRFGLYGAASATTAGYFTYAVIVAVLGRTPVRTRALAVGLAIALVLFLLNRWLGGQVGVPPALAAVTAMFLAYSAGLMLAWRPWRRSL